MRTVFVFRMFQNFICLTNVLDFEKKDTCFDGCQQSTVILCLNFNVF